MGVNILQLAIAVGRYVSGNPDMIARIVFLVVKSLERIQGVESDETEGRGLPEHDLVDKIVEEYKQHE